MKKIILFLICLLSLNFEVNASTNKNTDPTKFQKPVYSKINLDAFNSVVDSFVLSDGSYFLLVYEREYLIDLDTEELSTFQFNDRFHLMKYTQEGELLFDDILDIHIPNDHLKKIISLEDGSSKIIITSEEKIFIYDLNDHLMTELEVEGINRLMIKDIIPLKDERKDLDGFMVVGQSGDYYKMPQLSRAIIMMFNANYELEWVNIVDEFDSFVHSVTQVNRLEYVVVGTMLRCNNGLTPPCSAKRSGFVAKYDFTGHQIWFKEIDLFPNKVIKTKDDQVVIAGKKVIQPGINTSGGPGFVGGILKMDHQYGVVNWEAEYSNSKIDSYGFIIYDITETDQNEFVATGLIDFPGYYSSLRENVNHLSGYEYHYFRSQSYVRPGFIVNFNSEGTPQWDTLMQRVVYYHVDQLKNDKLLFTGDIFPLEIKQQGVDDNYHRSELYGVVSITNVDEIDHESIEIPEKNTSNLIVYLIILAVAVPLLITVLILDTRSKKRRNLNRN